MLPQFNKIPLFYGVDLVLLTGREPSRYIADGAIRYFLNDGQEVSPASTMHFTLLWNNSQHPRATFDEQALTHMIHGAVQRHQNECAFTAVQIESVELFPRAREQRPEEYTWQQVQEAGRYTFDVTDIPPGRRLHPTLGWIDEPVSGYHINVAQLVQDLTICPQVETFTIAPPESNVKFLIERVMGHQGCVNVAPDRWEHPNGTVYVLLNSSNARFPIGSMVRAREDGGYEVIVPNDVSDNTDHEYARFEIADASIDGGITFAERVETFHTTRSVKDYKIDTVCPSQDLNRLRVYPVEDDGVTTAVHVLYGQEHYKLSFRLRLANILREAAPLTSTTATDDSSRQSATPHTHENFSERFLSHA